MKHTSYKILVILLTLAIVWFPLTGFSAGCIDDFPVSGDRHAASVQQSHADADSAHYQATTPACPDCDTHQDGCNGHHAQCSSGITLILQTQVTALAFTPSSWLISQDAVVSGTHFMPAIRPPISA